MRLSCTCLNICVNINAPLEIPYKLLGDEASQNIQHPYFQVEVLTISEEHLEIKLPHLITSSVIGSWKISKCLICCQFTHACHINNNNYNCSTALKDYPNDFVEHSSTYKMSFSTAYEVFLPNQLLEPDVCVMPSEQEMKRLDPQALLYLHPKILTYLSTIKERSESLDSQSQSMNLTALKRKAQLEEKAFICILMKQMKETEDAEMPPKPKGNKTPDVFSMDDFEDAIEEIEDEFEDEEYPEPNDPTPTPTTQSIPIAQSAPINVPAFQFGHLHHSKNTNEKNPKGMEEIATSIQQLAKSVGMSSIDYFNRMSSERD